MISLIIVLLSLVLCTMGTFVSENVGEVIGLPGEATDQVWEGMHYCANAKRLARVAHKDGHIVMQLIKFDTAMNPTLEHTESVKWDSTQFSSYSSMYMPDEPNHAFHVSSIDDCTMFVFGSWRMWTQSSGGVTWGGAFSLTYSNTDNKWLYAPWKQTDNSPSGMRWFGLRTAADVNMFVTTTQTYGQNGDNAHRLYAFIRQSPTSHQINGGDIGALITVDDQGNTASVPELNCGTSLSIKGTLVGISCPGFNHSGWDMNADSRTGAVVLFSGVSLQDFKSNWRTTFSNISVVHMQGHTGKFLKILDENTLFADVQESSGSRYSTIRKFVKNGTTWLKDFSTPSFGLIDLHVPNDPGPNVNVQDPAATIVNPSFVTLSNMYNSDHSLATKTYQFTKQNGDVEQLTYAFYDDDTDRLYYFIKPDTRVNNIVGQVGNNTAMGAMRQSSAVGWSAYTKGPTAAPTGSPVYLPTTSPTTSPTKRPTGSPTFQPTSSPTPTPPPFWDVGTIAGFAAGAITLLCIGGLCWSAEEEED